MKPNYRMVKLAPDLFVIRLVCYTEQGEVESISGHNAVPSGEFVGDLIDNWHKLGKAFTLPVLTMPGVDEAKA